MNWVAEKFKLLFQGIGRYKGPPVQIWVKPGVRSAKEHPVSLKGTMGGAPGKSYWSRT